MTVHTIQRPAPPAQADWPDLKAQLLHDIERTETRWQTRLVNATSERSAETCESVLSDVWFVQSSIEEAVGPLEAWKRLDGMRAGRGDAPAYVREYCARLAAAMYGPVVGFSLEEECSRG